MGKPIISALVVFVLLTGLIPTLSIGQTTEEVTPFTFNGYHNYTEVKAELESLSNQYDSITDLRVLGQTWEGRDILALRLTDNPGTDETGEPDVLIMGGHHANELPSVEVPMYIMEFLVGNYSTNSTVRRLVDSTDIWFVPLLNPDGREYALEVDGTWRKNRRPIDLDGDGSPEGYGVDLNRNYGHLWGQLPGTSHDLNDRDYCGPAAFSENETTAIKNLAMEQWFDVSLSYHTYGQVIYYPWNNNIDVTSPKGSVLEAIASEMGERNGYTPVNGVDAYPTTGDSDDWLYANTSCLPFTIELGLTFVPPPSEILSMCENNLASALYSIDIAEDPQDSDEADWTFMVYMSADNNLNNEALADLNEMEDVGSTDEVNIIVLYDGQTAGDSKLYRILKDNTSFNPTIISEVLVDGGQVIDPATNELDMTSTTTLRNFIDWTIQNFPAQKYVLDFWGHGNGLLSGFCPDGPRVTDVHALGDSLAGLNIDIVGFDTCSMGQLEVAYELMDVANIYIGSEALEPLAGWDYLDSLTTLITEPNLIPKLLAGIIVSDYLTKYPTKDYITMAAIDLHIFKEDFLPRFGEFLDVSLDFVYHDYGAIWTARNHSNTFVASKDVLHQAVDIFGFLQSLKGQTISEHVRSRLLALEQVKSTLVIRSGHGSLYSFTDSMAIYFPSLEVPISSNYALLGFNDELWDEYLEALKSPRPMPTVTPGPLPEAENTTGPYVISATVADYAGANISLYYRINNGTWSSCQMVGSGNQYTGNVTGSPNGSLIEFYFQASKDSRNITHPYENKWGAEDYFNITVFAKCDIELVEFETDVNSTVENGTTVNLTVLCINNGSETTNVNVSVGLFSANESLILDWKEKALEPGSSSYFNFTWTAVEGIWTIAAQASVLDVYDVDLTNQNNTLWLNVNPAVTPVPNNNGGGLMDGMGAILLTLAIISLIPVFVYLYLLSDQKKKRKFRARKQIRLARQFIQTAGDFNADTSQSSLLLSKAEVALARGDIDLAEKLSIIARERAMDAVGEKK